MNDNSNQAIDGEAKAKPEVIKLGLDLHARQVTECRQLDGSTPKPAQKWDPWKLLDKVEEWVRAGIKVYSCYEAGACGYWYHRELIPEGSDWSSPLSRSAVASTRSRSCRRRSYRFFSASANSSFFCSSLKPWPRAFHRLTSFVRLFSAYPFATPSRWPM